jgi:DNA-binding NarL/FixJ family response regulator
MTQAVVSEIPATPAKRYRLLFADDHKFILDALTYVAGDQYDVEVVTSAREFEDAVKNSPPDLAILDVQMPDGDGFLAARKARELEPNLKLMFLSMHTGPYYVKQAAAMGAQGYISKASPADELLGAIDTVVRGGTYVNVAESTPGEGPDLTERQGQVLRLISQGMSAKEIANALNISVRTAEFHRAAIMDRLKLNSTAMLTRYAIEHGLG